MKTGEHAQILIYIKGAAYDMIYFSNYTAEFLYNVSNITRFMNT